MHVLDGIANANGEVRISGSRYNTCQMRPSMAKQGGPRDNSRFHPVHVANNFNFNLHRMETACKCYYVSSKQNYALFLLLHISA
jgi:hypothetical protein